MFYTSVVLFAGFFIFLASNFGGTQALGLLISLTLGFAMFSNLILLPSLLMTLDKVMSAKDQEKSLADLSEGEE
jgi:predicted RND superfamily exporter protein